ncbi:MAG: thermonuclease family protein [Candidatus Loosdrechtia sp.]|uniref:thermonuclease family protein n=1 Tax=Candidatus Loosdrechtia sp. TaxID=3101272 RepID=UPI003A6B0644|nr:MAG: thermonuclease family protein [Candidatus Jettenia sp. AMX2]
MRVITRHGLKGLVFLILLFFAVNPVQAEISKVRVVRVPDGDTLILENQKVVRLKGIDAPETGHHGKPAQYFSREATMRLRELVLNKVIILKTGKISRDRHNRTLAYACVSAGENINLIMVREGMAFCYPHPDQDAQVVEEALRAQQRAMDLGLGFWPRVLVQYPEIDVWTGNKRSMRFHRPACVYGKRTAPRNVKKFSSLRNAFYAGFAPCRRCTPWPSVDDK